ncbi:uncharacterized protein LOC101745693 [Bombyx mori]|uniref:Uncharacterized protein n=1 Tax=Bombyx mori TaxID=7091 RepID=A0A8R1WKZ4_BOMMO|nr:uncharacterized protein LOC101745693 [Bombyx mori]
MPCKCTGIKGANDKCSLKASLDIQNRGPNRIVELNEAKCKQKVIVHRCNIFTRTAENIYDKCASYNLRYCPFGRFVKSNNHLVNVSKDVLILLCFLIANFIVLMIIIFNISCDVYFGIKQAATRRRSTSF